MGKTKVLVTGGAGYIGSVLTPLLLQEGYAVTVVDNFIFSQTSLLDLCSNDHFRVVRGDARDRTLMKGLLKDADVIIPLAAIVGAPACSKNPEEAKSINLGAVRLLVRLRSRNQIIIFPNTNSGYGIGKDDNICTEETPLRPISLYGRTKVDAERTLLDSGNAIAFRLATVFGLSPRMRLDLLVNDFTYRAFHDRFIVLFEPHFKRNYIHIRDVALAFAYCIRNFQKMKNQRYNVGLDSANCSKEELCQRIKHFVPDFQIFVSPIGKDIDRRDYIVSNEKIRKAGFRPRHSLDFGIQELIKGFAILNNRKFGNV